jgi:micrococcal nuclease
MSTFTVPVCCSAVVHPRLGAFVAVTAAASVLGWRLGVTRPEIPSRYTVVRALDGDTIDVSNARGVARVRLLGVDTPELHHPTKPVQCFAAEAAEYTAAALVGRAVHLEFDRERRDKYGRLLAYVFIDGHRYNDDLLREGYARVLVIPPNGRYSRTMLQEELHARAQGRGLWGAC